MDAKYNRVELKYCDEINCEDQLGSETKIISSDIAVESDQIKVTKTHYNTEQQRTDKPNCVSSRAWEVMYCTFYNLTLSIKVIVSNKGGDIVCIFL